MSDWEVGDVAVCVERGPIECAHAKHWGDDVPPAGTVGKVIAITHETHRTTGQPILCGCPVLILDNGGSGIARRFRKIRPDKHEACEEEFTKLLTRIKTGVDA